VNKLKEYSKDEKPSRSLVRCLLHQFLFDLLTSHSTVWTAWEQDVEKRRREGVLAELERRKAADAEAEARRQEIRNSIK
jgi:hypothetical protein